MTRLTQLSDNLFLFSDTCNVYVIKDGDRAVLIDFGSGAVLDHLVEIGVSKVDWVLHTHHHRDQAQGDPLAVEQAIPIAVPEHEVYFFREAEHFWRTKRINDNALERSTFLTLTQNVPVAKELEDYEFFEWGPYRFLILPTPGHTRGAITLLGDIDGKMTAFTGDLVHSPGKPVDLHSLQVMYAGMEGFDLSVYSIEALRRRLRSRCFGAKSEHRSIGNPLLCPSHGEPMADADAALVQTSDALKEWFAFQSQFDTFPMTCQSKLVEITPHLIGYPGGLSAFYALLSKSGKALFIDYGLPGGYHYQLNMNILEPGERLRFVEHSLDELRANYGMRSVDVAIPTHYHHDHIAGFPYLRRHEGTKVWALENMIDILQNPLAYKMPGLLAQSVPVDRRLRHEQVVEWEEYELQVVHFPGHSEYHAAIFLEVDGERVAFTGDNFFQWTQDPVLAHQIIYRNQVRPDSHLESALVLADHDPDIICPGHGAHFDASTADLDALVEKMEASRDLAISLASDPQAPTLAMDPAWAHIYPYQSKGTPGGSFDIEVRVRNHCGKPIEVEVSLVLPSGWTATPERQAVTIIVGDTVSAKAIPFTISVPASYTPRHPRIAFAADVTVDGRRYGQVAEGLVCLDLGG